MRRDPGHRSSASRSARERAGRHPEACCSTTACLVILSLLAVLPVPAAVCADEHPDVSGEKLTSELCLGCHEDFAARLGANRHAALEEGCTTCHDVVTAKAAPYLSAPVADLCGTCHDTSEKGFQTKHGGQPVAAAGCTSCHNPHASSGKKLLAQNAHPPFAEGQCDSCHEAPEGGKVKLVAEEKELCLACHEDLQKKWSGAKVYHAPIETDGCSLCHGPHASDHPAHLRGPESKLCGTCHEDTLTQLSGKSSHEPVSQPGCRVCHDPHASALSGRLRSDVNTVCLGCHLAATVSIQPGKSIEVIPGVSLASEYLAKVPRLNLDQRGVGHPISNHPVGGRPDPSRKGESLSCLSCHRPHGSDAPSLIRFSIGAGQGICQACHQM